MNPAAWLVTHEAALRLAAFAGVALVMALWEWRAPRRPLQLPRRQRWTANLGLVVLDSLLVRLVAPAAALGVAALAEARGWGLFHVLAVPGWLAFGASVVILDFVIWLQHVMVHAIPLLWRIHRVHHADLDYDFSTGVRFHPLEILLSLGIKFAAIVLLGPPLAAVVTFEILLNVMALFNHGNVGLPPRLERVLRWLVVTPDMHRVHHSWEDDEANSNFGFNLSLWDRLFGTYRAAPRAGQQGMTLGIRHYRDPRQVDRLPGLLWLPFRGRITGYAINRRRWEP